MYKLVSFSQIKENKRELIPEIAEGNIGLEYLLTYCVEQDVETYSSCGDIHPYISFVVNEKTKNILYNLCSLLIKNTEVSEHISVKFGYIKKKNVCRISYYDNDNINIIQFFVIIVNYLKEALNNEKNEIELWENVNEVIDFISKHGFDNYLEVVKVTNLDSKEDAYMYYLTVYSTDYRKAINFKSKFFSSIIQDYISRYYNDYSVGYHTDDVNALLASKKLVRKK